MFKLLLLVFAIPVIVFAQTNDSTSPRVDFTSTIAGIAAIPCGGGAAVKIGARAYATDAAAGANLYSCTGINTWSVETGGGGSGGLGSAACGTPSVGGGAVAPTFSSTVNCAKFSVSGATTVTPAGLSGSGPYHYLVTNAAAATTTGTASSGSTALTIASGTGTANGQAVIAAGIQPGTTIVSGGGTTSIVLSAATTAALSTTSVTFMTASPLTYAGTAQTGLCQPDASGPNAITDITLIYDGTTLYPVACVSASATVLTIGQIYMSLGASGPPIALPLSFASLQDAATVNFDAAGIIMVNRSLLFTVHGGSRTLTVAHLVSGGQYVIPITQDSTGGEGLTLGSGCTWKVSNGGGGAITLSSGVSATDVLAFTYDGTNCYANLNPNFN